MALIDLYQNMEHRWKNVLPNYDDIIIKLREREDCIVAVTTGELPYKELLEKYKIPALLNADNGILFGHEMPQKKMFLVIWKNRKLYTDVMEWNLEAHVATPQEKEELIKQQKIKQNSEEGTPEQEEGTPEQKEEQFEEGTPEQKEEQIEEGTPEQKEEQIEEGTPEQTEEQFEEGTPEQTEEATQKQKKEQSEDDTQEKVKIHTLESIKEIDEINE